MKSSPARLFWLIVKHENCRIKVLTIESDSGTGTLPIFGHKEEAEIFLWLNRNISHAREEALLTRGGEFERT